MHRSSVVLAALFLASSAQAADFVGSDLLGADLALADGDTVTGVFTNVGAMTIPAFATVTVVAGAPLEIHASSVDIDGILDGTGGGDFGGLGGPFSMGGSTGGNGQGLGAGGGGGTITGEGAALPIGGKTGSRQGVHHDLHQARVLELYG